MLDLEHALQPCPGVSIHLSFGRNLVIFLSEGIFKANWFYLLIYSREELLFLLRSLGGGHFFLRDRGYFLTLIF